MSLSRFSLVPLDLGLVVSSVDMSRRLRGRRDPFGLLCAAAAVVISLTCAGLLVDADAGGRYGEVMLLRGKPLTATVLAVDHECLLVSVGDLNQQLD